MARLIIYVLGLGTSVIGACLATPTSVWFPVLTGLAVGFVVPLVDALIVNAQFLTIMVYSLRTWRTQVRISASYLYRIRVDNDYLLVKGQRFDQYQPVGGVYKSHASSSGKLRDLGVLDDQLLVPDNVSEGDLRVRVPGKHLLTFVQWFEDGRGRECDGWREFYEELVATGILSGETFRVVKYDTIRRYYHPLRYSEWAQSKELLIADILELIPTPSQIDALRALKDIEDPRILWASEQQIRRLGASEGVSSQTVRIAETARWTIDASL